RDVYAQRPDPDPFIALGETQADLDRKLRAVLSSTGKVEALPHRTDAGRGRIPCPVSDVDVTKALGKQDFDVLFEQLAPAVAEHLLDLDVGVHDPPVAIDDQYPFTRRLQERPGP